jgi:hypothetical protein
MHAWFSISALDICDGVLVIMRGSIACFTATVYAHGLCLIYCDPFRRTRAFCHNLDFPSHRWLGRRASLFFSLPLSLFLSTRKVSVSNKTNITKYSTLLLHLPSAQHLSSALKSRHCCPSTPNLSHPDWWPPRPTHGSRRALTWVCHSPGAHIGGIGK